MRAGWRKAQEESAELFKQHARPIISNHLHAACLDVELSDSPLDVKAGIDYCLLLEDGGVQGLAVRMVKYRDYRNFALKLPELSYLRTAEQHGYLRPHYYCQGFVVAGELKSLGLVRIPDLLAGIRQLDNLPVVFTAQRDKRLLLVDWWRLEDIVPITIWRHNAEGILASNEREQAADIEDAETG